jgi:DNA helicase HerA-like ATPase
MLDITRLKAELGQIHRALIVIGAGKQARHLFDELRAAAAGGTDAALVWQALFSDCLRIVHAAVTADNEVRDDEVEAIYDMMFSVARHYSTAATAYRDFAAIDHEGVRPFLACYETDSGSFGKLAKTRWPGLALCRRAAAVGDRLPLERYERTMTWLIDAAYRVGGITPADSRWRGRTAELEELRRELAHAADTKRTSADLRDRAFVSASRVFSSVQQASSVFDDDPFDVETVHAEARATFERMVDRATTPSRHGDRGRMLLVLGDSGAGKTHLMRAFRRHVQEKALGFVAYLQMQSNADDYARYVLQHVVDSFAKPYAGPVGRTGLQELASGLHRLVGGTLGEQIARLATAEEMPSVNEEIDALVDELLAESDLSTFDPDLLRVLLHALRPDARVTNRVYKYLRCEDMTLHDRKWIGGVSPKIGADDPSRIIRELGRLAWTTQQAALVLMVDQAELAGFDDTAARTFRRAIDAFHKIASELPSAVTVIACLGDLYTTVRPQLTKAAIDRLETDPGVERLSFNRSFDEIQEIVAKRLAWLFAEHDAVPRPEARTYPIPESLLRSLVNRRTRDVLEACHAFQERCAAAGRIVDLDEAPPVQPVAPPPAAAPAMDLDRIASAWNDARHGGGIELPDDDAELLELVSQALRDSSAEHGLAVEIEAADGFAKVTLARATGSTKRTLGIVNRGPQRGAFGGQLERLQNASGRTTPFMLRTLALPTGPASKKALADFLKGNGLWESIDEPTLRLFAAHRAFRPDFPVEHVAAWRRRDRPLSSTTVVARILDLELDHDRELPAIPVRASSPKITAEIPAVPQPAPSEPPPTSQPPRDPTLLDVGTSAGFRAEPRTMPAQAFVRHVGVLGTTGSGKTTLALHLIEQLLERQIPVVLVDRKGDLAGYAREGWWQQAADNPRARAIAETTDVRLFTPGIRGGRPLALSVIPDVNGLPDHERSREVAYAANALVGMMGFGDGANDRARRAILLQAIEVLAERRAPAHLDDVIELLASRDDDLITRASRYQDRLFDRLVQDLETLRLNDGHLFDPKGEPLTAEILVGRRNGRTPLSIVSTRFLGEVERVQSWVAHLIGTVNRHIVRTPSSQLQLVMMFDEADLYMPAGTAKPPSKEPLQDLLKRARTGGLGVMLASQSPADFDYRSRDLINTWFVGKIGEPRAIDKVKQLFEQRPNAAGKLGTLETGHFMQLHDGAVSELVRTPSLLRTDQLPESEILSLATKSRAPN